jgi:hypothetical protein
MRFQVGAATFAFRPHPIFPADEEEVWVVEGGEALVYQVQDLATGEMWALKLIKPLHRGEHVARAAAALAPYAKLPGLSAANRICLTRETCAGLLATYPQLEYGVLMPWLAGRSWSGYMQDRLASAQYGIFEAFDLALATAHVLWNLEAHHLAHTDVAGGNVVISMDFKRAELLDMENLYIPGAPPPERRSGGTPGYQHRHLGPHGQCCAEGDRFAGAVLLTEMLAWSDPLVRARTPDGAESLFQPHELQEMAGARWEVVRNALWALCPAALHLFDQAWASAELAECPELSEWALALLRQRGQL